MEFGKFREIRPVLFWWCACLWLQPDYLIKTPQLTPEGQLNWTPMVMVIILILILPWPTCPPGVLLACMREQCIFSNI
jgi:hypothetical protein